MGCQTGYDSIPHGQGFYDAPMSGATFTTAAPSPDTREGFILANYAAAEITVQVPLASDGPVTVDQMEIAFYNGHGRELESDGADFGQTVTVGQSVSRVYAAPPGAASCTVLRY